MIGYGGAIPCFLFGRGLIGRAVDRHLRQQGCGKVAQIPYDWNDGSQRRAQRDLLRSRVASAPDLSIIWTAGRAGFGAEAEALALEHRAFRELLTFATEQVADGQRVHFLLTSSAGGLFEGQEQVGTQTQPAPQRPYGHAKLRQEMELRETAETAGFCASIFRPSSVFGFEPGCRLGLMSALIVNTMQGEATPIYGSLATRRDYVSAGDVGTYIARRALDPHPHQMETYLLGRGVSHSIAEIVAAVGAELEQTPALDVQGVASNAAHMSFAPEALPPDWAAAPLEQGIKDCVAAIRAHLDAEG